MDGGGAISIAVGLSQEITSSNTKGMAEAFRDAADQLFMARVRAACFCLGAPHPSGIQGGCQKASGGWPGDREQRVWGLGRYHCAGRREEPRRMPGDDRWAEHSGLAGRRVG